MRKNAFAAGICWGSLQRSPDPLADFLGCRRQWWREGKGKEEKGEEGKGGKREGLVQIGGKIASWRWGWVVNAAVQHW